VADEDENGTETQLLSELFGRAASYDPRARPQLHAVNVSIYLVLETILELVSTLLPTALPANVMRSFVSVSGVTNHRQPRQCLGAHGSKSVMGAQSDPNYVSLSRLLLDCSLIKQVHVPMW